MSDRGITAAFIGFGLALLVTGLGESWPGAHWFPFALAAFVVVAGLPHGGLDVAVSARIGLWRTLPGAALFHLAYAGLALAVFAAWQQGPQLCLAAFLLISAWHFGTDFGGRRQGLERLCLGSLPVSVPVIAHEETVLAIYGVLIDGDASTVVGLQQVVFIPLASGAIYTVWRRVRDAESAALGWVAVVLFAFVLSPLLFFALYFCCLHSPRHLYRQITAFSRESRFRVLVLAASYSIIAALLVPVMLFASSGFAAGANEAALRGVFIGLAALTVPHMLLIDAPGLIAAKRTSASRRQAA